MSLRDLRRGKLAEAYTPNLIFGANVNGLALRKAFFAVSGQLVQVWGVVDVDPALGIATNFTMTLPFGQNLTAVNDLIGNSYTRTNPTLLGFVDAETNSNTATIFTTAPDANNFDVGFDFAYLRG